MWYLKVFLLFLVVIVLLLFGLMNKGQIVSIHWINPNGAGTSVDFILALFVAYSLGGITFFFVGAFREFRQRHRNTRLQRRLDELNNELDSLRTSALDGPLTGMERSESHRENSYREAGEEYEDNEYNEEKEKSEVTHTGERR